MDERLLHIYLLAPVMNAHMIGGRNASSSYVVA